MRKYWNMLTTFVIIGLSLSVLWLTAELKERDANALKIDKCVENKKPTCEVDGIVIKITYDLGVVTMRKD